MRRVHASYVKCAFPQKPVQVRQIVCDLLNSKEMGDAANAHQRNIYNKKIPTLEYVDGQVR